MTMELSIIVAVYNLEKYLPRCIDSILAQTFRNFELILVNDGSTDNSGTLCEEYARKDARIKVIHQENGGTASSRNTGIKAARGKYIGFVDNDDYVNQFMFETLYEQAEKHQADLVICDYVEVDEHKPMSTNVYDVNEDVIQYSHKEALHQIYTPEGAKFIVPWNKLYKKSLFDQIHYREGSLEEDETVAHKILYASKNIIYVKKNLYYYVNRKGSITNAAYHMKKADYVYTLKHRADFLKEKNEFALHEKALKHYLQVFFWNYYTAKEQLTGVDKELKKLKKTYHQSLPDILKLSSYSKAEKVYFILFRISPKLYDVVLEYRKGKHAEYETK